MGRGEKREKGFGKGDKTLVPVEERVGEGSQSSGEKMDFWGLEPLGVNLG